MSAVSHHTPSSGGFPRHVGIDSSDVPGSTEWPKLARIKPRPKSPNKGPNIGATAGAVAGGVCGLALLAMALWYIWRRRRRTRSVHAFTERSATCPPNTAPRQASPPVTFTTTWGSDGKDLLTSTPLTSTAPSLGPSTSQGSAAESPEAVRPRLPHPPLVPHQPLYEYAQDYEDVMPPHEPVLLPPRYKETWGPTAGPSRAEDLAVPSPSSPLRDHFVRSADSRAGQLKRELISLVDNKALGPLG